ncbi:MAG TPA: hypothetical protein PKB12_05950, partial [Elusimicrobiota bacterium]|nr:hypothetical protein [Elusimicrobiota bacterium]
MAKSLGAVALMALTAMSGGAFLAAFSGVLGAGWIASSSLGGQRMYSHSVADQHVAYRADGSVDESLTRTDTVEEHSYVQGLNFGDKVMMVSDIAVAVIAVVTTFASAGAATGFWATFGSALLSLAPSAAYQAGRQGISINDFEAHADRQQAHGSRMLVANYIGQAVLAGAGSQLRLNQINEATDSALKSFNQTQNFAQASESWVATFDSLQVSNNLIFAGLSVSVGLAEAALGGAKGKTLATVAAISTLNALMHGYGLSAGGDPTRPALGELVRQIGMTYGKSSQRTTWMIVGTGIGASGPDGNAQSVGAMAKTFALNLYSRRNDGRGGTDAERYQRGFVLQSVGEALGTIAGIAAGGYTYSTASSKIARFMEGIKTGLAAPFKALASAPSTLSKFFSLLMMPKTGLSLYGSSLFLRGVSNQAAVHLDGNELTFSFDAPRSIESPALHVGSERDGKIVLEPGANVNGMEVLYGEMKRNGKGGFDVSRLVLKADTLGALALVKPGVFTIEAGGSQAFALPSGSLGLPNVSFVVDGLDKPFLSSDDPNNEQWTLTRGQISISGQTYTVEKGRLASVDGQARIIGALLVQNGTQYVMDKEGNVIALSELRESIGPMTERVKSLVAQTEQIQKGLANAYDRLNDLETLRARYGDRGLLKETFHIAADRSAAWRMSSLRTEAAT